MDKEPDVTIITAVYGGSEDFLKKISKLVKEQKYSGKVTHIFINDNLKRPLKIKGLQIINNKENLGVAKLLNTGFKMAKTEIVISLLDDCIPSSKDWLRNLVKPLIYDKEVAATSSLVELPKWFWDKFDFFAKAMTEKEQKEIVAFLDAKGCAYRVSALKELNYINDRDFKNGGEDTDLTARILQTKKWKIMNTSAKVYHFHNTTTRQRIKKEIQYAQIVGLVSRKRFFNLWLKVKLNISLKIGLFLLFFVNLIFNFIPTWYILLAMLIISNQRLPAQIKRFWPNQKIILLPFFNFFLYLLYVVFFLRALLFKPTV